MRKTMVQMNFQFAPTGVTKLCHLLHKTAIILFGWVEIGVYKVAAFAVHQLFEIPGIFGAPSLHSPGLLISRRITCATNTARFKVVSDSDDQVNSAF